MTSRERRLTDPDDLAAAAVFAAALKRRKLTKAGIAAILGVTPGLVSQWAHARVAIPADRAQAVAAAVGTTPEQISPAWRAMLAKVPASQGARLDPQMMAETLVAVLKAQESDRRQFMPKQTAIALCALYEVRANVYPASMSKEDLAAFDNMVMAALNKAWGEHGQGDHGRTAEDNGGSNTQPAKKRSRA